MALNANALTTVAQCREWLTQKRTEATTGRLEDEFLEPLVNRVSSLIETHCGRRLLAPAVAETYIFDADCLTEVCLWRIGAAPIVSVTSLTNLLSGEVIPARPSATGIGYTLTTDDKLTGRLRLDGYRLDRGIGLVQVVARCGFDATVAATSPATRESLHHRGALDTLEQACLLWCAALFHKPNPITETVTVEGASFSTRGEDIPPMVEWMLEPYRLTGVG